MKAAEHSNRAARADFSRARAAKWKLMCSLRPGELVVAVAYVIFLTIAVALAGNAAGAPS